MCYQLTKLLEELKRDPKNLGSYWIEQPLHFVDGVKVGKETATKDIIKRIEKMLTTSKCKGNHLG